MIAIVPFLVLSCLSAELRRGNGGGGGLILTVCLWVLAGAEGELVWGKGEGLDWLEGCVCVLAGGTYSTYSKWVVREGAG